MKLDTLCRERLRHSTAQGRGGATSHSHTNCEIHKTFAYQLWLEQGKTDEALVIVSKALGHKSTGVTMDYLGIRREQIAEWQSALNL